MCDEHSSTRIKHVTYTYSTGDAFGDHYITRDNSLPAAEQFDITVYPTGDNTIPLGDPDEKFRYEPHVHVRVFLGGQWETRSRTYIGK